MPSSYLRPVGVLLVLFMLLGAASAQAQSGVALASLEIELWPEFDQPTTLVILDGRLEANVTLPTELTIRIPSGAGQPHAVAVRNASGELLNTPYTTTPLGDDLAIVLQTDALEFRVEYYDPGLTFQENERAYTFQWLADYPVQGVAVRVQQPANASGLTLEPTFTSAGVGEYGLNYHVAALGPLTIGQALTVQLAYQKSTATLSVDAVGAASPSTTNTPAQAPASLSPWLVVGLSGGTLLLVGGLIWYARSGSRPRSRKSASHSASAPRRRGPVEASVPEQPRRASPGAQTHPAARFCTHCGQPAEASDQFCRKCGTKLRV